MSELKSGSPGFDPSGLSVINISFKLTGPRAQIATFVSDIASIAPITVVNKIKISESSPGLSFATISVKSFWSPFPTKIPAVDKAVSDLTPAEQQTLQDLGSLVQPIFNQVPVGAGGKSDPFSL